MLKLQYGVWQDSRNEAKNYHEQSVAAVKSSMEAFKRGDRVAAEKFSNLARHCGESRDQCNKIAADLVFKYHNKNLKDTIIDLHCLHVKEALDKLMERIDALIEQRKFKLNVIVGRGNHSVDGPVLKPTVIALALNNHIPHEIATNNPGLIHLVLPETKLSMTVQVDDVHDNKRKAVTLDHFIVKKSRQNKKDRRSLYGSNKMENGPKPAASEIVRNQVATENTLSTTNETRKSRRRSIRKKKQQSNSSPSNSSADDGDIGISESSRPVAQQPRHQMLSQSQPEMVESSSTESVAETSSKNQAAPALAVVADVTRSTADTGTNGIIAKSVNLTLHRVRNEIT